MKIVIIGFTISCILGCFISAISSIFPTARKMIMPFFEFIKNIPSISLFPVFIILLGIGDESRIAIIIWNSIYSIISSSLFGLDSCDKSIIEAALNCGANRWQLYYKIKLPLSAISVLNGSKIAIGNGFIAVVVAEMLGATKGLGYMVIWSANSFNYSKMFMYIAVIAFIGFVLSSTIDLITKITEKRLFS